MIYKRKYIVFWALAIIATALIGVSLSQLDLKPGLPLPELSGGELVVTAAANNPGGNIQISTFLLILLGIAVAILGIITLIRILRGVYWKSVFSSMLTPLFIVLILVGIIALFVSLLTTGSVQEPSAPIMPTPEPIPRAPLGPVPPIILWVVGLGLALGIALLCVWAINQSRKERLQGLRVVLEAERARNDLLAGQLLKDVILRCYQQMSQALQEVYGLERETSMTVEEFERLLEGEGYPHAPVHQLTTLFEAVRYGNWHPTANDEQNAIACLEAIIACIPHNIPKQAKAGNWV